MTDQTNATQPPAQDQNARTGDPQHAPDQTQASQTEQHRPADTLRDGAIKASIWRNEGDNGPYYATNLSRTYTDQDGNRQDSNSFIGTDLLKVAELARGAYERTNEMRRAEFMEQRKSQGRSERSQNKNR